MNLGMESETLEFKKSTSELDKGVISLASMLNKHGEGTLYFGVNNDGTIVGQKQINENTLRDVSRRISEGIEPQIIPHISLELIGDVEVIKVYAKGNETPYSAFGIYYIRSFDEDRKMDTSTLKSLMFKDGEPDRTLFEVADTQDLTFETLKNLYINHGLKINQKHFEENLGFYTSDGKYNKLAELLADNNHTSILVVTFAGNNKTVMLKRTEYGGKCLISTVNQVLEYMESINETKVKVGGITRQEEKYFDFECFREAWINAVVHNRWVNGAPPSVYIYDNKIEIVSDGGLPLNLSIEDYFNGVSKPRNKRLLDIFKDLELVEKTGHGVPLIVEKYGRDIFKIGKQTIQIFIPINKELLETSHLKKQNDEQLIFDLNTSEKKVLEIVEKEPYIKLSQIVEVSNLSSRYVDKVISSLKEKGYIERIGSKKSGYWKVNK